MSARPVTVVVGGGHNGLTAAALLARAGRRVVVCEARSVLGGLAAGEEFHPGYRTTGVLHDSDRVRPAVVRALDLAAHGYSPAKREAPLFVPERDGPGIVLHRDANRARAELALHSERDAQAYIAWRERIEVYRATLEQLCDSPPPDPDSTRATGLLELLRGALTLRLLGADNLVELTRVAPMCVADWLNEWFETPLLKAALAAPGLLGNWCGPWSPGTAGLALLHEGTAGEDAHGGPAALIGCLERAARHHGAELRLDARVERIGLERGRVASVILESGETLPAEQVLTSCSPRTTFLELLEPRDVPIDVVQRIACFRVRGTTAKLHLALDGMPRSTGRPDTTFERLRFGEDLDDLERAFDAVKYGALPERPHLDVRFPSVPDPELAPPGYHVASVLVHFVPHALDGGWTDAARDTLRDLVLRRLAECLPDVRERLVGVETLTPVDLEERYELPGGHVLHGEHALDQLAFLRPEPSSARSATVVPGLYLCGSGSHPGGGVTCGPGALGARAALADRR